jgi:hypothetical protein
MPLQVASAPAEAFPLLAQAVRRVSSGRGATGRAIAVPDPSKLSVAIPHQVYFINVLDEPLSRARLVSWRFLLVNETTPLAVIDLHCDSTGGNLSYAKTTIGPFVAAIQQAVATGEHLDEVVTGTYELRALIVPSIYLQALWLKDLAGSNDIIISFKPTSPGTFQVLRNAAALAPSGGGPSVARSAQRSVDSFFAEARQTASRKLAFNNAPRRGISAGASGGSVQPQRSTDMATNYSGMSTGDLPAGGSASSPSGGGAPTLPLPPTATKIYPAVPNLGQPGPASGGAGGVAPGASGASPYVVNRQDLIKNYANMVARTWTDPSYLQLLLANPVQTLDQAGIPTIPGAVIRVLQIKLTGIGRIEEVVDKWIDGIRTGQYDLFIPIKPDGISIGAAGGGDVNCCCTPCCCCT